MRARTVISAAACAAFLIGGLLATAAQGQLRPWKRVPATIPVPQPASPAPAVAPAPTSPVPPATAPGQASNQAQAYGQAQISAGSQPFGIQGGQILRGSQLIGMQVWNPENQVLGAIRDFVVEPQGACPAIFFVMAPAAGLPSDQLVVLPFDALQYRFIPGQRIGSIVADVRADQLVHAPHIVGNNFGMLRDPQFIARTQQFFRSVQRTAARPGQPARGSQPNMGQQPSTPGQPQPGVNPQRQPPSVPQPSGSQHTPQPQPPSNPAPTRR